MKLAVSTTVLLGLLSGTNGASSITRKRRATYIVSNPVMKGRVSKGKQMFEYVESNPEGALPEDKEIFGALGDMKGSVPGKDDDDDCKGGKGGKGCDDDDSDDDDDGDKEGRSLTCVIDGQNYLRCDPDTVKKEDVDDCDKIEDEICGEDMVETDKAFCECIGLYEEEMPQLRGAVAVSA